MVRKAGIWNQNLIGKGDPIAIGIIVPVQLPTGELDEVLGFRIPKPLEVAMGSIRRPVKIDDPREDRYNTTIVIDSEKLAVLHVDSFIESGWEHWQLSIHSIAPEGQPFGTLLTSEWLAKRGYGISDIAIRP